MEETPKRRPKGSGTLYVKHYPHGGVAFVAEKRWKDSDGKQKRVSAEGSSELVAFTRLAAKLNPTESAPNAPVSAQRTPNTLTPQKPKEAPTKRTGHLALIDYSRLWSEQRQGVAGRGRRQEQAIIENHVIPTLGHRQMRTLRANDFNRLLEELKQGKLANSPAALKSVYRVMHNLLGSAERLGHITRNPLDTVAKPVVKRKDRSAEMAVRLVKLRGLVGWLTATPKDGGLTEEEKWKRTEAYKRPEEWARLLVSLLGLRPSEAIGLQWADVHLSGKDPYILVKQALIRWEPGELRDPKLPTEGNYYLRPGTKNDDVRRVPLNAMRVEALRRWKEKAPKTNPLGLVFVQKSGLPHTPQGDRKAWAELLEEAQKRHKQKEIWSIGFNRHIAVTLMLDQGTPQAVVAGMMGHTIVVENQHYYAPQQAAQRKALDQMAKTLPFRNA